MQFHSACFPTSSSISSVYTTMIDQSMSQFKCMQNLKLFQLTQSTCFRLIYAQNQNVITSVLLYLLKQGTDQHLNTFAGNLYFMHMQRQNTPSWIFGFEKKVYHTALFVQMVELTKLRPKEPHQLLQMFVSFDGTCTFSFVLVKFPDFPQPFRKNSMTFP